MVPYTGTSGVEYGTYGTDYGTSSDTGLGTIIALSRADYSDFCRFLLEPLKVGKQSSVLMKRQRHYVCIQSVCLCMGANLGSCC